MMYRVWQFTRALTAQIRGEEWALVRGLLSPSQLKLFQSMPRRDQRHGLDLVYTLSRQGYQNPALLRAALLHDVGKADSVSLWHRIAVVLLERFAPRVLHQLASDRPESWRYPFFAHLNHPSLGAQRVKETGGDRLTVELIRRHHQPVPAEGGSEVDRLLLALQDADGRL